jgi:LSD1 subclass zinc finger protein
MTRTLWLCQSCRGPFQYPAGDKPNFCPYCRSRGVALLLASIPGPSYTISSNGKTITCHECGLTSANSNDVAQRYCGHCHLFHEDLNEQRP